MSCPELLLIIGAQHCSHQDLRGSKHADHPGHSTPKHLTSTAMMPKHSSRYAANVANTREQQHSIFIGHQVTEATASVRSSRRGTASSQCRCSSLSGTRNNNVFDRLSHVVRCQSAHCRCVRCLAPAPPPAALAAAGLRTMQAVCSRVCFLGHCRVICMHPSKQACTFRPSGLLVHA